jgi:hypothetical protein
VDGSLGAKSSKDESGIVTGGKGELIMVIAFTQPYLVMVLVIGGLICIVSNGKGSLLGGYIFLAAMIAILLHR